MEGRALRKRRTATTEGRRVVEYQIILHRSGGGMGWRGGRRRKRGMGAVVGLVEIR